MGREWDLHKKVYINKDVLLFYFYFFVPRNIKLFPCCHNAHVSLTCNLDGELVIGNGKLGLVLRSKGQGHSGELYLNGFRIITFNRNFIWICNLDGGCS